MNTKIVNGILFVLLLSFFASCDCIEGEGKITSKSKELGELKGIILDVPAKVLIEEGQTQDVVISARENIFPIIDVYPSNGILRITSDEFCIHNADITIKFSAKVLELIQVRGSGDVICKGDFDSEDCELRIDGSGDIRVESINADEVQASINGSGDIRVNGKTKELEIDVNGSGSIYAQDLQAKNVGVVINGSGDCRLHAKKYLDVTVRGSGDVYYHGSPEISTSISGSGSVKQK